MKQYGNPLFRVSALIAALIYVLLGVIWIAASDEVARMLADTLGDYMLIQAVKGWFFVFVSGLLVYFLVRLSQRRLERAAVAQQEVESTLRESEEKHRGLFETMAQGVIYQDREGRIISANPAAERILGLTEAQLMERKADSPEWRAIWPDGSPLTRESHPTIHALITGKEVKNVMLGIYNPEKAEHRWLQINAVPRYRPAESQPYQVYTTFEDITELRQLDTRARSLAGIIGAILETSPLAIFDLDLKGCVKSIWNASSERIYGWKAEEVLGKDLPSVPELHREEFLALIRRVAEGESVAGMEVVRERKDGMRIQVQLAAAPLRGRRGKLSGIIMFTSDITERKQLEKQFFQAQKMEAIGRLAGGLAHDFNNLLTVILGNADLLGMGLIPEEERHQLVDEISSTARRASRLTAQLLAFARRQIAEPVIINLNDTLLSVDKMLRRLIGENIEFVVLPEESLWNVKADAGQIEQVLTNLVVNAVDAMPQGGKLTLETANMELDEEYAKSHVGVTPGEFVMFAVSDSGIGMDREILDLIFDPFFTTKGPDKGTGLGLATCYAIVKQHGGNIWVYSEPGKGSAFKIYLPRATEGEALDRSLETDRLEDLRGSETILLVEDEPLVGSTGCRMLERGGYTVLLASNGEEAERIAAQYGLERIDLLITDVVMPRMGGKELFQSLSLDKPGLKVLYISGYTDNSIVHNGILDEGTQFLQKPFNQIALLKKVRRVLDSECK
ncbi:PAS domain S-box protein [bacterium]|nr:PAS domain S-box protein [bacterium]